MVLIAALCWCSDTMMEMGEFNSDDRYIYYHGQESLKRKGGALMVKSLKCSAWVQSQKMIEWTQFVFKAIHSTSQWFKSRPQPLKLKKMKLNGSMKTKSLYRTNTKKKKKRRRRSPFHHRGLKCKSRKSRDIWRNRQVWPWSTKWSRVKANRVCKENALIIANILFQQHKRRLYKWTSPVG